MIRVGTTVTLKVSCLQNKPGTRGVCYEVYQLEGRPGYSFIFENGEYDGFSPDEVESFLTIESHCKETESYVFSNVMTLSRDFDRGYFNTALQREVNLYE